MKIIKINFLTLYFVLLFFLCGMIKEALIIFFIVLIHELGHATIAKCLNFKVLEINIYPFGGITKLEKDINTPIKKELMVAFGGILFQIILGFIIYLLPIRVFIKSIFFKYNVSIILFNLIPIIPLDGSIILNSLLNYFFSFKKAYIINIIISIIAVALYIFTNYWFSLNNYLLVGLFLYKIYTSIKNYKYIKNRFLLERFLNNYHFKYISTKRGNLDILKIDTYQYFKTGDKIVGERKKLQEKFDNTRYF